MGIFTREKRAAWHPSSGDPELVKLLGGLESASGIDVTETTALGSTGVWCAVSLISSSFAMLPCHVIRRRNNGQRRTEIDRNHDLYALLHDNPNPELTSMEFRGWLQANLLIRNNAYAQIVRKGNGRPAEMWPLRADKMAVRRKSGRLYYEYRTEDGEPHILDREDVFHIRGFSTGGLVGLCALDLTADAIGLGMAHERYASKFFANGAFPGGVLEHPEVLDDEAAERLRKDWERIHKGLDKQHRIAILEEGMTWKQVGVSPRDAQLIDARTFQLHEVSRIFHVPPHMLYELSRSTFNNIEHQQIAYVMFSLAPWIVRWEQRYEKDLFTDADRNTHFVDFSVEGLLRGDTHSRYEAYRIAIYSGWRTPNEVRDLENLDPKPGLDNTWMPASMMMIGQGGEMITPTNQQKPTKARNSLGTSEIMIRDSSADDLFGEALAATTGRDKGNGKHQET